jgi:hypothetical protein
MPPATSPMAEKSIASRLYRLDRRGSTRLENEMREGKRKWFNVLDDSMIRLARLADLTWFYVPVLLGRSMGRDLRKRVGPCIGLCQIRLGYWKANKALFMSNALISLFRGLLGFLLEMFLCPYLDNLLHIVLLMNKLFFYMCDMSHYF